MVLVLFCPLWTMGEPEAVFLGELRCCLLPSALGFLPQFIDHDVALVGPGTEPLNIPVPKVWLLPCLARLHWRSLLVTPCRRG